MTGWMQLFNADPALLGLGLRYLLNVVFAAAVFTFKAFSTRCKCGLVPTAKKA